MDAKLTLTQGEVYLSSSKTHLEETLSEKSKASATTSTKDTPNKMSDNMMASSKNWNYQSHDIIYNLYKDHIFQNKNQINYIYITAQSFIKDT